MKLKELISPEGIKYCWTDGGYHKDFSYNDKQYHAFLLPFASTGSACTILKIDDADDINNITASEDTRKVFYKRYNDFKENNLTDAIKEFIKDYAR